MKSGKTSRKDHFPFDLYKNPLKSRHRDFLADPNYAGKNQHQTADETEDKLEKSVRQTFHILLNHQKLEKSKVYNVINAKSMHHILDAAIKDYDLRSSELVRLFFEMSIIFLKNSPNFESQKEIIEDMANPLSKFFQMLSESLLQKEDLEKNIKKEERDKIKDLLKNSRNEFAKKEYDILKNSNDELYREIIEQDIYQRIISKQIESDGDNNPVFEQSVNISQIVNQIKKNNNRMKDLRIESFAREDLIRRLSNAYNHLEPYLCRIKPLKEFEYMLMKVMLNPSYISDLDKKFTISKLEIKFTDLMLEKHKNKKTSKKTPSVVLRHLKENYEVRIPKAQYEIEKREFFKKHGIDIGDKPDSEKEAEVNFDLNRFKPRWAFDEKYSLIP